MMIKFKLIQIRVFASLFSAVFLLCFCVSVGLCGQDYVPGEIIIIICRVPDEAQSGKVTVTTSEGMSNEVEITILESFYDETLIKNEFLGAGTAQGWQTDGQTWLFQLPFSFPFFGQDYDSVYVCSNGFLDFTDSSPSYLNSQSVLKTRVMIAPLWSDLITNGVSQQDEDIYVHSPSGDSVCFRWSGERVMKPKAWLMCI
jgi:hypothetical protein